MTHAVQPSAISSAVAFGPHARVKKNSGNSLHSENSEGSGDTLEKLKVGTFSLFVVFTS